jgi:hypothetical protein
MKYTIEIRASIAVGWTAGVQFPARARDFSLQSVQTGSGAHLASFSVDTGGSFPGSVVVGGMKLTTHFHLVLRSRMVEIHLHSPICLHDIVLNCLIK